jgi:hypothetical protein
MTAHDFTTRRAEGRRSASIQNDLTDFRRHTILVGRWRSAPWPVFARGCERGFIQKPTSPMLPLIDHPSTLQSFYYFGCTSYRIGRRPTLSQTEAASASRRGDIATILDACTESAEVIFPGAVHHSLCRGMEEQEQGGGVLPCHRRNRGCAEMIRSMSWAAGTACPHSAPWISA